MPKDKKTLAFVIRRTYRIVVDSSHRDVAQPGSAFAWGARGREFESRRPDQKTKMRSSQDGLFCCLNTRTPQRFQGFRNENGQQNPSS